ncbi:hypothetical protein WDW86_19355, partial [Bdellovibrionota bacterium FG-2]
MNHAELLSHVAQSYSALGERPTFTPKSLSYYHCPRWRNWTMSPVFIRGNVLSKEHLLGAEKLFASYSRFHPFDSRFAYLNLLGKDSSPSVKAALKTAKDAGWEVNPNKTALNYWEERLPLDIPKTFSISAGRYFDPNYSGPLKLDSLLCYKNHGLVSGPERGS